ncbi:MAG TPA: zincin-like metallopeptidase domain-containing protein [Caulobacteraceae bacterium]|nr:zincin-like metallopeptidase domain-containing protein [Caulobacteraceae bacterium]
MHDSSFSSRSDVHQAITTRIIAAIEAGAGEFVMPWHRAGPARGRPTNAATEKRYRGTNVVGLWAEATLCGYGSGRWATYRQWQSLGAQVRRGEHGAVVVFYRAFDHDEDEQPERPNRRLVARASRVFNAEQVDGWREPTPELPGLAEALPDLEGVVSATGANVRHGGERACYRLKEDLIEIPERNRFVGSPASTPTEAYYATLLHELVHWTGASHRLARTFGERFGDAAYGAEELVAELGAAFLCADLRVSNEPRADHAAYVGAWISILKADARVLFTASGLASEAASFILTDGTRAQTKR